MTAYFVFPVSRIAIEPTILLRDARKLADGDRWSPHRPIEQGQLWEMLADR